MKITQETTVFEKSDTLFQKVQFVLKATCTDISRPYVGMTVIEDEGDNQIMVVTDGHRLHACLLGKAGVFPCGRYSHAKEKSAVTFMQDTSDRQFPNWRAYVPETTVKLCCVFVRKKELHEALWPLYSIGVAVRVDFITDLAECGEWEILQSTKGKQDALVCRSRQFGLAALIMPLNSHEYSYPQIGTAKKTGGLF